MHPNPTHLSLPLYPTSILPPRNSGTKKEGGGGNLVVEAAVCPTVYILMSTVLCLQMLIAMSQSGTGPLASAIPSVLESHWELPSGFLLWPCVMGILRFLDL